MDPYDGYGEETRRVQVRFTTKLQSPLRVPPTSIAIPSNLTRKGLSVIVNNLLKAVNSDWEPRPFDFLVDDELIRMSLEDFLLAKGISAEKILEIEYIKAVAPRKQESPCLHDDWVSAISGLESSSSLCVATASKDRTLRLWKFDSEVPIGHPAKVRAYKTLKGHKSSVQSIAAHPSGMFRSWDSTINLWRTNESDADGDLTSIKKRKVDNDTRESQSEGEALYSFVGHTQCVSSVVWKQEEAIYSASWDHSIRRWDVGTGKDSFNLFCGKALNCLDVGGEGSALIAAGGSDSVLRIWDPRNPGSLAPVFQFSSHSSWISACKWHDHSWFHLISASYDGKVMLWDLRTAWPVAVIDSHKDKVLCVDWWKGDSVISGGADAKLCISSEVSISSY
ncbi:hypothetical protein Syun_017581 [Stephania yunnanensis]|uniref:NLE domain-containing protein n=1 Tax=Stephania yunnanensis TaxID=152371 RepID=A0AAP0P3H6_9MAGN